MYFFKEQIEINWQMVSTVSSAEFFWGLQLTEVKKINGEKFLMGGRLSKVNNFSHAY